jgi:hypothetical protein
VEFTAKKSRKYAVLHLKSKGETIHRMHRNRNYFGDGSVHDTMLIKKKKSSVELPFSSLGDHLINILRKVNH